MGVNGKYTTTPLLHRINNPNAFLIDSLAIVEGYFVVELTLLESPCRQVYTISESDHGGELYDRY